MQWIHGLVWQAGEYIMNALMDVFSMDMAYFKSAVPVSEIIMDIMFGVGWALLLGNLVFQAAKSMMTGLGFEGEDPRTLGMRTMVFAFLLAASRQICEMGLSLSAAVVDLLQISSSVILPEMKDDMFGIDASWLIMIIISIIILFQLVKFFFEVGERYVIVGVLTILSPLAFAMGGSRNTMDIFKGWVRMYGSMCLMLVMNVVFMKLIVSAMAIFPSGLEVFPWTILIIALARVARKIDSIVARIGLNPAITGDGLGRGFPGMMALMVGKSLVSGMMGGRFGAAKAAAGTAAVTAAQASGFKSGARPGPSPINTGSANGTNVSPRPGGNGFAENTSPVNAASTTAPSYTEQNTAGIPVNPPVGRSSPVRQGGANRPAATPPSAPFTVQNQAGTEPQRIFETSSQAQTETTVNRKLSGQVFQQPQASHVKPAAPSQPLDTSKSAALPGQGTSRGTDTKSFLSPRVSGETNPIASATVQTVSPRGGGAANPVTPVSVTSGSSARQTQNANRTQTVSPERQRTSAAGRAGQPSSVQNNNISPIQTAQSNQQNTPTQVSAASSQRMGVQTQQNNHQNTQNQTFAGSRTVPQPVRTQTAETAVSPVVQKERVPKPVPEKPKSPKMEPGAQASDPKVSGKNKAPAPVDIGPKPTGRARKNGGDKS